MDTKRITAAPTLGPRGGFTRWVALLDGRIYFMGGSYCFKAKTKQGARMSLIDYFRRHPEKLPDAQ